MVPLAVTALLASACGRGHPAPETGRADVAVDVPRGEPLEATLYRPMADPPAGLLLLTDAGGERIGWVPLATRARDDGFLSLAVDLPRLEQLPDDEIRRALHDDIAAALEALVDEGAPAGNLGLVGAGTAANLALDFVVEHPRAVQALVLVSPGLELGGIDARPRVDAFEGIPVLFVTMTGDAYGAASARSLRERVKGFSELHEYSGSARGEDIFALSESALEQVVYWLGKVLNVTDSAGVFPEEDE